MLKIGELKSGDVIGINDEGIMRERSVVDISREEHQALVNNGIQEFWYSQEDMFAVPLDESHLLKFGFTGEENEEGYKFKRDSFRVLIPKRGDFSKVEMWWREDRRHFYEPLAVHEFQNLYLSITKVHLDMP
jgi:hypothetical protein